VGLKTALFVVAVGSLVAVPARAQDEPSPGPPAAESETHGVRELDVGAAWLDRPPPLTLFTAGKGGTRIGGLPDDLVHGASPLYLFMLHAGFTLTRGPFVLPIFGLGIGFGGGGYPDTTTYGDVAYRGNLVGVASFELGGIGLRAEGRSVRGQATLVPSFDAFWQAGHLSDPSIDLDATGYGKAFALRARGELCGKHGDSWLCVAAGPTLIEGERFLDGGFVALQSTL
jgi:hypothetical protein